MSIAKDVLSKNFKTIETDQPIRKAVPLFDASTGVLVVLENEKYQGIISERQLLRSNNQTMDTKVKTFAVAAPTVKPETDIIECARLMVENTTKQLPVFDDGELVGVVTVDDILRKYVDTDFGQEHLKNYMSKGLVVATPKDSLGKLMTLMREYHIARVPIVGRGQLQGLISLHDVLKRALLPKERPESLVDEKKSVLFIPVEGLMTKTVYTLKSTDTVKQAIQVMFDNNISSIVVVGEDAKRPIAVVTKRDLLAGIVRSQQQEASMVIQITSKHRDLDREAINKAVMRFVDKYKNQLGKGYIHIHVSRHKEKIRDASLWFCRLRLSTEHLNLNVRAEGFGEDQVMKLALRRLKTLILKQKPERHHMAAEEYFDYFYNN